MSHSVNSFRLSTIGNRDNREVSIRAAELAHYFARQEIEARLKHNTINVQDTSQLFKEIYSRKYYEQYFTISKLYEELPAYQEPNFKYKFFHPIVRFTKRNNLIVSSRGTITINEVQLGFDIDNFGLVDKWPGPLDLHDKQISRDVENYTENLLQHDSQRKFRYSKKDDQRKLILKLLIQLLQKDGFIDGPGVTRLLLPDRNTEINPDEKDYIETLKKYLVLGKRLKAIDFSKCNDMWDHAQCLAFLDKYQPQSSPYNQPSIKGDIIIELNQEYISKIKDGILQIVYQSLLNRILSQYPSDKRVKSIDVGNDHYKFAMLCANDCEMDYDHNNEIFKLIRAVRSTITDSDLSMKPHYINLGMHQEISDIRDESISLRSSAQIREPDNESYKTLLAPNLDLLRLNEIWEFCFNLRCQSANKDDYRYIFELIPSKLILASKLLDYGRLDEFEGYLSSLQALMDKISKNLVTIPDEVSQEYDWAEIGRNVDYLSGVYEVFRGEFSEDAFAYKQSYIPTYIPHQPSKQQMQYANTSYSQNTYQTPQNFQTNFAYQAPVKEPSYPQVPKYQSHKQPSSRALPLSHSISQQTFQNSPYQQQFDAPIPQGFADQSDRNDYSRRESFEKQPSYAQMASSSLMHNNMNPESFSNQFSPINEYDYTSRDDQIESGDYQSSKSKSPDEDISAPPQFDRYAPPPQNVSQPAPVKSRQSPSQDIQQPQHENQQSQQQPQPHQEQNTGESQNANFFTNLIGTAKSAILPKSNSKQMILPDDKEKSLYYDEQKKAWVDKNATGDDGIDDFGAPPPPKMPEARQTNYNFDTRSSYKSKKRYPQA